jgi:hypothetical protein
VGYPCTMGRFPLILFTLIFAGSAVVFGARDIRKRLAPPTEAERTKLEEMMRDWRGETVIPAQRAAIDKEHMPHRSHGSYLPRGDIERLKRFVSKLISSDDSEAKK